MVSFSRTSCRTVVGRARLGVVEAEERVQPLDGIGCQPVLISATTEEVLAWISAALQSGEISFPENNGPILWPSFLCS